MRLMAGTSAGAAPSFRCCRCHAWWHVMAIYLLLLPRSFMNFFPHCLQVFYFAVTNDWVTCVSGRAACIFVAIGGDVWRYE